MSPFTFVGNRIDRFVLSLISRHALEVLKREYGCTAAHQILWDTWHAFGELAPGIPALRLPATRVTLSFAAAWVALHRGILGTGADEPRATAIVAEVQGRSYGGRSPLPWWLTRLITLDTVTRPSVASRLFGRIADGSSHARREVPALNGSMTTEIDRCAALTLYPNLGIAHLSRPLVCGLALAAAEEWDARLTRGHSDADGDARGHLQLRSIALQHGGRHAEQPIR